MIFMCSRHLKFFTQMCNIFHSNTSRCCNFLGGVFTMYMYTDFTVCISDSRQWLLGCVNATIFIGYHVTNRCVRMPLGESQRTSACSGKSCRGREETNVITGVFEASGSDYSTKEIQSGCLLCYNKYSMVA